MSRPADDMTDHPFSQLVAWMHVQAWLAEYPAPVPERPYVAERGLTGRLTLTLTEEGAAPLFDLDPLKYFPPDTMADYDDPENYDDMTREELKTEVALLRSSITLGRYYLRHATDDSDTATHARRVLRGAQARFAPEEIQGPPEDLTEAERETYADTVEHINAVRRRILAFCREMMRRAERHDASKLRPPELPGFAEASEKLGPLEYGTKEYFEQLKELPTEEHYAANDHHPEHYPGLPSETAGRLRKAADELEQGIVSHEWVALAAGALRRRAAALESRVRGMGLPAFVEMAFDWFGGAERHDSGDPVESVTKNAERFSMSEPMVSILHNAAKRDTASQNRTPGGWPYAFGEDPYGEGEMAFEDGWERGENPHEGGTDAHADWFAGWDNMAEEERRSPFAGEIEEEEDLSYEEEARAQGFE